MGKSSVFAAWERAYFVAAKICPTLNTAARQYGFILIALSLRHYAALPVPDANRPESWVLEIVRRQLEQHGFATRDLGLVDAILRAGHIAVALDGTNEVDRDLALAAFASQFPQTRLLVTSQAIPRSLAGGERWEVWELPEDIGGLRDGLLALWLGAKNGAVLCRRIVAGGPVPNCRLRLRPAASRRSRRPRSRARHIAGRSRRAVPGDVGACQRTRWATSPPRRAGAARLDDDDAAAAQNCTG